MTLPDPPPAEPEPVVAAEPPAGMDMDRLETARSATREGDFDKAVTEYGELLQNGVGLDVLIGDLEQTRSSHRNPLLTRLLGDVYMRDGQLQNALDSYRQALDLM